MFEALADEYVNDESYDLDLFWYLVQRLDSSNIKDCERAGEILRVNVTEDSLEIIGVLSEHQYHDVQISGGSKLQRAYLGLMLERALNDGCTKQSLQEVREILQSDDPWAKAIQEDFAGEDQYPLRWLSVYKSGEGQDLIGYFMQGFTKLAKEGNFDGQAMETDFDVAAHLTCVGEEGELMVVVKADDEDYGMLSIQLEGMQDAAWEAYAECAKIVELGLHCILNNGDAYKEAELALLLGQIPAWHCNFCGYQGDDFADYLRHLPCPE